MGNQPARLLSTNNDKKIRHKVSQSKMMQPSTIVESELTEAAVRKLSKAKNEPEWMLQTRLEAYRQFEKLELPQLSYGLHVSASQNINMKELRPVENATSHQAAMVDGGIIEDLSAAATTHERVLRPLLERRVFQNKLDALHAAFWNDGLLVYMPKKNSMITDAAKVQLLLKQKHTEIVYVVVVAEENSNINVTEFLVSGQESQDKGHRIELVAVYARAGAKVGFATLQKLGTNVQSIISRQSTVENSASVDWSDISIGGGNTKQETVSNLNSEGATSTIRGAFFGDGTQQLDIMAKAVHNARSTTSNMSIKGALKGRSKAIVQSFTKITKNAANSAGHQKANILLLSDSAKAAPIPKLEIDNYDVKASHEASVGRLDSEKLFYMLSRGLETKEAMKLVVEGFFEPLLRQIQSQELAEELRQTITAKMETAEQEVVAVAK